jgi:hypothetical protein
MKSAENYIAHFVGERSEKIERAIKQLETLIAFADKFGKQTPKKLEKIERAKKLLTQIQSL